jgi:hypothetical protein
VAHRVLVGAVSIGLLNLMGGCTKPNLVYGLGDDTDSGYESDVLVQHAVDTSGAGSGTGGVSGPGSSSTSGTSTASGSASSGADPTGSSTGSPPIPGTAIDEFWDDFEDGQLDANWNASQTPTGCTVQETGGVARFTMDASGPSKCMLTTFDRYDIRDADVLLDVPAITFFFPPLQMFMVLTTEAGETIQYGFDGNDAFFVTVRDGNGVLYDQTSVYEPRPRYWRVRETAGVLYFESSPDAATWDVELQTSTPFYVGAVTVGFGVTTSAPMDSPVTISVPNYNIAL